MTKHEPNNRLYEIWMDSDFFKKFPDDNQGYFAAFAALLCELLGQGEWND